MNAGTPNSVRASILPPNYFFAGLIVVSVLCFLTGRANPRGNSSELADFQIGERLIYRVDWQKYSGAAEAELDVIDCGNFYGRNSWHFRAILRTLEPARALYPLDDQLDSYDQLHGFSSFRYQQHLREFGKPRESNLDLVSPGSPISGDSTHVIVPPGTHDPVSAVYFLRQVDWQGIAEVRMPVYDGEDLYDMHAQREGVEEIRVAAGDFSVTRIAIRLLENGREVPDERFKIWLARDAAQTPVIFEAQLPVGVVRAELTSASEVEKTSQRRAPLNPPARSSRPAGN